MLESRTYSPSNGATSNTPNHPIASLFLSSYPMQLEIYKYQLSQTDPRDAMTRASCCSIHLDVNAQWDKLAVSHRSKVDRCKQCQLSTDEGHYSLSQ